MDERELNADETPATYLLDEILSDFPGTGARLRTALMDGVREYWNADASNMTMGELLRFDIEKLRRQPNIGKVSIDIFRDLRNRWLMNGHGLTTNQRDIAVALEEAAHIMTLAAQEIRRLRPLLSVKAAAEALMRDRDHAACDALEKALAAFTASARQEAAPAAEAAGTEARQPD